MPGGPKVGNFPPVTDLAVTESIGPRWAARRQLVFQVVGAFFVGNAFFNDPWVTAPSSTTGRDGLGPTFNATSCAGCHFKDGRGAPPTAADDPTRGLLLRISVPGPGGTSAPVPGYGDQLQDRAIAGVAPEAADDELPVALAIALRLRHAGASDELIATALGIEPEGVGSLLTVAEAKLRGSRADPQAG